MKKIYTAKDNREAHLIVGKLASEGIEAEVQGQQIANLGVAVAGIDALPTVWIKNEADYEKAKSLLNL